MIHRREYMQRADAAAAALTSAGLGPADVVLQCGSGIAPIADLLLPDGPKRMPLADVPHLPAPRVAGHGHEAVYGVVGNARVLVLTGRLHVYEGHSPEIAGFPAAVAKALGARLYIATNAAGGLNQHFAAGDAMIHSDFVNFQGDNAVAHIATDDAAERFVDPKPAYQPEASRAVGRHLAAAGLSVHEGVYVSVRGPLYETRAELYMLRSFGGDAIGMSTVPEISICCFLRLAAVGVSIITNECFAPDAVTHDAVVAGSVNAIPQLAAGLRAFLVLEAT